MDSNKEIPEEEVWTEWRSHPATKFLRRGLRALRENYKEQLAEGDFVEGNTDKKQVAVIAQCKIVKSIMVLDYGMFLQEIEDANERNE